MQQLSPMRTRPSLLAFGAIAFVALLVGLSLGLSMGTRSPTSALTPTPAPSAGASAFRDTVRLDGTRRHI